MKVQLNSLKVAIVYDRVNKFGGAERVLLALHEMFPDAPLYTSVYKKENAKWADVFPEVYTSFLQNIPVLRNHHELLGWLMPMAFEQFNFDKYDLVISVTSEAAKGIITGTKTFHLCYCLTPTRYLWSGREFYLNNPPKIFKIFPFYRIISWPFLTYAKWWDKVASQRPDKYIAISTEVQKRIKQYYGRDSEIIFPPVSLTTSIQQPAHNKKEYYLIHGRFEPYKRLDLIIDAFKQNKLPLIVSGSGSEFERYSKKNFRNIKFIEKPTDDELVKLYSNAKAFLMPQFEDFGITAVEAQSYGVPVIAYNKGGSCDTVVDGKTGVMFNEQTKQSLNSAIKKFDTMSFDSRYLITNAKRFGKDRFKRELQRSLVCNNICRRRGDQIVAQES
ncbi:MAG: glycosyltransferase [Microgenomates group bacterium]